MAPASPFRYWAIDSACTAAAYIYCSYDVLILYIQVEIVPFCHEHTTRVVEGLSSLQGCRAVLRRGQVSNNKQDGADIAITDNGNYIIDLHFTDPLKDIALAATELTNTVGVVEHGLFVNMASAIILASTSEVSIIDCKEPAKHEKC